MYEDITLDQASELLARRRVASAAVGGLVKMAVVEPDWFKTLHGNDAIYGTLRNALIGTGVGGAAGALGHALRGRDDDSGATWGGDIAHGALTGGAVGGGATAGIHGLRRLLGIQGTGPNAGKPVPESESGVPLRDPNQPPMTLGERLGRGATWGGAGFVAGRAGDVAVGGLKQRWGRWGGLDARTQNQLTNEIADHLIKTRGIPDTDLAAQAMARAEASAIAGKVKNPGMISGLLAKITGKVPGMNTRMAKSLLPRAAGASKWLGRIGGGVLAPLGFFHDRTDPEPFIQWPNGQ